LCPAVEGRRSPADEQVLVQNQRQRDDLVDSCHLGEDHQLLNRYQTRSRDRKKILLIPATWGKITSC
jgi:hypothetical protein